MKCKIYFIFKDKWFSTSNVQIALLLHLRWQNGGLDLAKRMVEPFAVLIVEEVEVDVAHSEAVLGGAASWFQLITAVL